MPSNHWSRGLTGADEEIVPSSITLFCLPLSLPPRTISDPAAYFTCRNKYVDREGYHDDVGEPPYLTALPPQILRYLIRPANIPP
jgi:hypothetical protein